MLQPQFRPKIQGWLVDTAEYQRTGKKGSIYEIEIRFKAYQLNPFKHGVPYKDFDRLRTYMNLKYQPLPIKQQTDESQNLGIDPRTGTYVKLRKTIMKDEPDKWIVKSQHENGEIKDEEYTLRYTFNVEATVLPEFTLDFKPETSRVKTRQSYLMKNGSLRADLTYVVMTIGDIEKPPTYEVELEIIKPDVSLDDLSDATSIIFKVLHDTESLYTIGEYMSLVNYVNRTLDQRSPDPKFPIISHWGLYQARNLHYKDMVTGGLVAHSTFRKNDSTTLTYSVTIKADGIRKLLVISPVGIWLVMSKNKVNLVSRIQQGELSDKMGYILEGELIPIDRRKNIKNGKGNITGWAPTEKYWYLVYDCLAMPYVNVYPVPTDRGDMIIQESPHSLRMKKGQKLINSLRDYSFQYSGLLLINSKDFEGFNTGYQLSQKIRKLTLIMPDKRYENDGFMFTPEEMPYNFKVKIKGGRYMQNIWSLPLYMRVLTRYPDICKWKPAKNLTIDFRIKLKASFTGENTIKLFVGLPKDKKGKGKDKGKGKETEGIDRELFIGTRNYPFLPNQVQKPEKGTITYGLPTGTIVEYEWDNSRSLMIPVRVRDDKQKPNLKQFADDTWDLIQNPISLGTLLGSGFKLMFKYHNRIKRNLFQTAYKSLKNRHGQKSFLTALDIGSGPGGDTYKLEMFDRIIFLEPTISYLTELSTRIKGVYGQKGVEIITSYDDIQNNIQNKIRVALNREGKVDRAIILNTGGENSTLIKKVVNAWLGGPASLISIMLSMSFFWPTPSMIKALETTIVENLSPGGEGIFFTIDGELVRHAFNPVLQTNGIRMGGQVIPTDYARFGGATLNYFADESKMIITIPDSLVYNQTEYPPYLADLEPGLKLKGWKISHLERADQELLLNVGETELSKLYMSGRILPKNFIERKPVKAVKRTTRRKKTRETTQRIVPYNVQPNVPQINIPGRFQIMIPPKGSIPIPIISPTAVLPSPSIAPTISIITSRSTIIPPSLIGLPVKPIRTIKYDHLPMIAKDDKVEQIIVPWYRTHPVVRIGTIGDGSCFFHAVLKAFYALYANNSEYSFRVNLVRKLRRDIAASLKIKNPESIEGKTFYQTAAGGSWVIFAEQQRRGDSIELDLSLLGIQNLLNSTRDVGDEVYQFVGDLLGINIYVMKATKTNLEPILNTSISGRYQPSVIIAGNELHYETVGIDSGPKVGIQTVFYPNDPFLIALRGQIHDEGGDKS